MSRFGLSWGWRGVPVAIAAMALLGTAGGVAAARPSARAAGGGTVTFAQTVGNTPNYIFPITRSNSYVSGNLALLQPLLWRPLYWLGEGTKPVIDPKLSLADPPVFSRGGRTVTITLKPYVWSNGDPVTSRDVSFFLNLIKAGKDNWGGYSKGSFPDNVVGFTVRSARTFSITFDRVYSKLWLQDDELTAIVPLPQRAWDRKSAGGAVGAYDQTAAGAKAVYTFLDKQALTLGTYASNPLWKVVDGPFRLDAYSAATNYVSFVPNGHYSGPIKPKIAKLVEMPFTSNTAEFNALRAGEVDYGYLPTTDLSQRGYFKAKGYTIQAWPSWGINYLVINWSNPTMGRFFKQLYIRQAMQRLVNQPALITHTMSGYGAPIDGPIPLQPKGPLVSAVEAHNPYPYDPAAARALLVAHGWSIVPNGTDTCSRPGTGAGECGAGIAKGAQLAFNVIYPSGVESITQGMEAWKSWASTVGMTVNLQSLPLPEIGQIANPCTKGPTCTWDLANWEGWGYGSPYPTGEETFSPLQTGGYSSPVNDANITATHVSSSPGAMFAYENYLARNLPVIWWPNAPAQISVIAKNLHGVQQNALGSVVPEAWSLSR